MKKFTLLAALITVVSFAPLASAQTATTQNPYAWMPMSSFWGSQTTVPTSTPNTSTIQTSQASQTSTSAFDQLLAFMPMFQLFGQAK